MDPDRSESGKILARQVVDAAVQVGDEGTAIVDLVSVSASDSTSIETLRFSLTPLQSLRLARDLLIGAERWLTPQ